MNKIIVIGCPGSGKSTFSRELHRLTGIPIFHLDQLYWNADKTTVDRSVFQERLAEAMAQSMWILDGNYGATMELRMEACDTVIFLDYPTEVCLEGIRARRGQARSDMPWVESDEDAAFLSFVQQYNTESRPKVMELLHKYSGKNIFIFTSRDETDRFLHNDML